MQNACPPEVLDRAEEDDHMSSEQKKRIEETNESIDANPGTSLDRIKEYYQAQSYQNLRGEDDRVEVPIWVDRSVHRLWHPHIDRAIRDINLAAPGLNLSKTESASEYKVKIEGIDGKEANTEGDILVGNHQAMLKLGHRFGRSFEFKQWTAVHELFHSLGFSHEQCRRDAPLYVENRVRPSDMKWYPNFAPDPKMRGMARFYPFSVLLYPEHKEKLVRKDGSEFDWKLKPGTAINKELSELDKL